MPLRCVVALGANLGDRITALREAVRELAATPGIALLATSPVVRTRSVGGPEGSPDYLNAVVELASDLTPFELLEVCQGIEHRHGRTREVRWGPRTLDLDVLLYAEQVIDLPRLQVPHPHLHARAFALVPLAELAPEAIIPGHGTVRHALQGIDGCGLEPIG